MKIALFKYVNKHHNIQTQFKFMQINMPKCLRLLVLASLVSLVGCNGERSPMDYLLTASVGRHKDQLDWVRKQVELEGGESFEETKSFLERTLMLVNDAILKPDQVDSDDTGILSTWSRSDVTTLWALLSSLMRFSNWNAEGFSTPCGSYGVVNFVTIFEEIFGDGSAKRFLTKDNGEEPEPEHDVKLFNYMKHYATEHYRKCLKLMELNSFEIHHYNGDGTLDVLDLDRIFLLGQSHKLSPNELVQMARELDLANGKFDAKKMYTLIDDYDPALCSQRTKAKKTFLSIDSICQRFRTKFANNFDAYNLARALVGSDDGELGRVVPKANFLKLNEYSRLCGQFQDPRFRDDVRANMDKNMKVNLFRKFMHGNNA